MIKVLKASAGSGKTFHLAKTYLELLLGSNDPYAYRHILAVTFTNKATAEMKNRILKELETLSERPLESKYYDYFVPSLFDTPDKLQHKARTYLVNILHDYRAFSVSTIDKFFQQTLKAFAREIGQFASYQIELDKLSLVRESVDRMLDSLDEGKKDLVGWLNECISDQLRQGRKADIENRLYSMAADVRSDMFREKSESVGSTALEMFSKQSLKDLHKECCSVIEAFEKDAAERAGTVLRIFEETGISPSLTRGRGGFASVLWNYVNAEGTLGRPNNSFFEYSTDPEKWFSKTNARYRTQLEGVLEGPLEAFCELFGDRYKVYRTAVDLRQLSFSLGLAGELSKEFDLLLKEKNVMSLDDSNTYLRNIIDGSDAPFVYEKLGVRYDHFLLDEFQDTATIQWDNFQPLVSNSDASGNDSLIVGDVKQSIYRWRGSDWKLLGSGIAKDFPEASTDTLKQNWRSTSAVVDFNNRFFRFAADKLSLTCSLADGLTPGDIYSDVQQEICSKDSQEGLVSVTFCDKKDEAGTILEKIREAVAAGAEYGDIAVLVRSNKTGAAIAAFLMDNGIDVISDDSLDIKTSPVVMRLVSLLSCVEKPEDPVSSYLVKDLDITIPEKYHSLTDLCEGFLRAMEDSDSQFSAGQTAFIQAFLDILQEWTNSNGNNLAQFLKYWDEKKETSITSPDNPHAVRIMTVHKSKGLEFPCIIFPFAEDVTLYKASSRWCRPEGEALEKASGKIFPVTLSSSSEDTLFAEDYLDEKSLQTVDNLNIFYVAMTRACTTLHVIASEPSADCRKAFAADDGSFVFKNLSQVLYWFAGGRTITCGTPYDFNNLIRKKSDSLPFVTEFRSFPTNGEETRLRFSEDSMDFFGEEGLAGASASARINGIILHDILSQVNVPGDLGKAVANAIAEGLLSRQEASGASALLESRIAGTGQYGWFSPDASEIRNEAALIDTDGSIHKPDRVVVRNGAVSIIDYKFGEEKSKYFKQVRHYASLYRRMGYKDVKGYLWFVPDNIIKEVPDA